MIEHPTEVPKFSVELTLPEWEENSWILKLFVDTQMEFWEKYNVKESETSH